MGYVTLWYGKHTTTNRFGAGLYVYSTNGGLGDSHIFKNICIYKFLKMTLWLSTFKNKTTVKIIGCFWSRFLIFILVCQLTHVSKCTLLKHDKCHYSVPSGWECNTFLHCVMEEFWNIIEYNESVCIHILM